MRRLRLAGLLLQGLGVSLMLVAGSAAVMLMPARAQTPLPTPMPVPAPSLSPTPQPTPPSVVFTPGPTPTPIPARKIKQRRGGRINFGFIGSFALGETSTSSTFGSGGFFNATPSPGASATPNPLAPITTTQTLSQLGAGGTAELSRRTAQTYIDLKAPVGLNTTGRSTLGVSSLLFSTPKYSLGYGPQLLDALGQLQVGLMQHGFQFITPLRGGQATLYEGPSLGAGGDTVKLDGILVQEVRGSKFFETGLVYGVGPQTGIAKTALFGMATVHKDVDFAGEAAWQTRRGGNGNTPHGLATQLRVDDTAKSGTCTSSARSIPNNYVVFGGGEAPADRLFDFTCHATKVPVNLDTSWERTGVGVATSIQRLTSLGYSPAMRFGGVSVSLQRQTGTSSGYADVSNGASVSLQTQLFKTSLLLSGQAQGTNNGGELQDTRSVLATINRQLGQYYAGFTAQVQTQSQRGIPGDASSPEPDATPVVGIQRGVGFNVARQFKRTTVQVGETITLTQTATSDAIQRTPLINLTRQISPALSVTSSLGFQSLTDRLNPASNGRTRIFSITVNAPFSYGSNLITGRVDPRLPATIVGRVVLSAGTTAGAALNIGTLGSTGGVGNVVVTLDGLQSQRTDLTGGFQFSFVSPGTHVVSISNTSIPRGFTAATPLQSIDLKGGQTADVTFPISTLGGVMGHVYGSEAGGVPVPLPGVRLQIDGGAYAQTDASGQYGFGALQPGTHEVVIIPQTVPASADFAPEDMKGKVSVTNGGYTTLDFHARVLGSISGEILFAKDMAHEALGAVPNAYVVAEPGEHAAIDEDDGSFTIDDLPPGDYTVSVDPETIDTDLGASPSSVAVHLDPGEHYKGILFSVGHEEKKVVFTLLGGNTPPPAPSLPTVHLSETRLPPKGSSTVTVDAPEDAKGVAVIAFGKKVPLAYDTRLATWVGEVFVPENAPAAKVTIAGVGGKNPIASATLVVDPKLPLVLVDFAPRSARPGQDVTVRVRFLADVRQGEKITWQDGSITVLGKPVSGRVFTFRKHLTLLPLHGLLLTPTGSLPIELL